MAGFVGIDIGKTHVRAVSLSVGYKRLSLLRLEEVALDAAASLESALQQVCAPLLQHTDGVAVAIDGQIYQDALFQEIGPDSEVFLLPQIAGG